MAKREYCKIKNLQPSHRTLDYIDQMNHVTNITSFLEKVITFVPFFQIFAGRQSYKGVATAAAAYNATTYEWELYHDAISSVDSIKRNRLEQIAFMAIMETHGQEKKFWECVYNAL